jgi:hypothetical protein
MLDKWPHPHNMANYELNSDRSCSVAIEDPGFYFRWLGWFVNENKAVKEDRSIFRLMHWGWRLISRYFVQRARYRFGSDATYKKGFEYIKALRTPREPLPVMISAPQQMALPRPSAPNA